MVESLFVAVLGSDDQLTKTITLGPTVVTLLMTLCSKTTLLGWTWPANSPDLNQIENIWDENGRRTYHINPPQTLNDLRNRLNQEWQNISQATIRCCIGSMRKRSQACINSSLLNSDFDIPLKVVKFNFDLSVLQRRCLKWILKFSKNEIKQLKEHIYLFIFV